MKHYLILKIQRFFILKEHTEVAYTLNTFLQLFPFITTLLLKLSVLEQQPKTFRTRLQQILIRMFFGCCGGFVFWFPFFGFILTQILGFWFYCIALCIMIMIIGYCLYYCYRGSLQAQHFNKATHIQSSEMKYNFFVCFWIILALGVLIFSLIHSNAYVLTSFFYPISIAIFLFFSRKYRFWFGFFVGIFGFYWLSLSPRFLLDSDMVVLPLAICVGVIYGILFFFLFFFNNLLLRFFAMYMLCFIHPAGFNWLNLTYFSAYSVFQASTFSLLCLGGAVYMLCLTSKWRYISVLLVLVSFDYHIGFQTPQLHAKIVQTNYLQNVKWDIQQVDSIIQHNFEEIQQAIDEGYPIIILPETSFPIALNKHEDIYKKLLEMSKKIIIFGGGMRVQDSLDSSPESTQTNSFIPLDKIMQNSNNQSNTLNFEENYINSPNTKVGYYNTTFIIANTKVVVADKIALVPFGETLPFNALIAPLYTKIFHTSFGFNLGKEIVTMQYNGLKIANANCYEGTMDLPYKHGAKYIIMESNNAWFAPSTQPFMQQMIIKYYARVYNVFIYHATNLSPKSIITPNNGKDLKNIDKLL